MKSDTGSFVKQCIEGPGSGADLTKGVRLCVSEYVYVCVCVCVYVCVCMYSFQRSVTINMHYACLSCLIDYNVQYISIKASFFKKSFFWSAKSLYSHHLRISLSQKNVEATRG